MRANKTLTLILALLLAISIIAGCNRAVDLADDASFEHAIVGIMDDRLTAIKNEDYDLYMSVITKNNQFLFNEQERWFTQMIEPRIHDVSFVILSTQIIDELTAVVNIMQRHEATIGFDMKRKRDTSESFSIKYPLLFKYESGKWMDYGYNFEVLKTDRFEVKYMQGEQRVQEFAQMLNDAFDNLDKIYELKPLDDYEMKLFFDREMLRQRSIPANPWLFTGWSEPDESLKIYTGHPSEYTGYPGVVQHELVHHISIRICNNNLPVWILEGIAMYDGSAYYGLESSSLLSSLSHSGVSYTIDILEKMDLGSDLSSADIYNFYNTSYMYVRYIVETYGRAALMDIFYEAGKKPFHDSTLNETFEQANQNTADEVFLSVLGLTKAQLSDAYLTWLDTLDFDNLG